MKKVIKLFIISGLVLVGYSNVNAQCGSSSSGCNHSGSTVSEAVTTPVQGKFVTSFEVDGKCGMCKARIETAAKKVQGIKSANWNEKTKVLVVSYDAEINVNEVHRAVAKAGHDTSLILADDDDYNAISACCKYERKRKQG